MIPALSAVAIVVSIALLIRAWKAPRATTWLALALSTMLSSGFVQRYVEQRRADENLTWTDPQNKDALEIGFLAMGGFRGLIADVLWVRAIRLQDTARYYELKLICELIQKLQPTFTGVHAFQAYNMSYNLARRATNCEDKWYWIRSGIATLENGLKRNKRHYSLWFELGMQYMDRLGDVKMEGCTAVRDQEMPHIDDLNEAQREVVFLEPNNWPKGHAIKEEYLRWAAYYFFKAMQGAGDPLPLRTERLYGNCLDRLGYVKSRKPIEQRTEWNDWGSEDWWLELMRRNDERGMHGERTVIENLRWCMLQQVHIYSLQALMYEKSDPKRAAALAGNAGESEKRFYKYFPEEKRPMTEIMTEFRKRDAVLKRLGATKVRDDNEPLDNQ